jgi:hypothetical protein
MDTTVKDTGTLDSGHRESNTSANIQKTSSRWIRIIGYMDVGKRPRARDHECRLNKYISIKYRDIGYRDMSASSFILIRMV